MPTFRFLHPERYRFTKRASALAAALAALLLLLLVPGTSLATTGTLLITSDTTLTENHDGSIVIGADNVTLDCAGHEVRGPGFAGVLLVGRSGVMVKNCRATGFLHGVVLIGGSVGNTLTGNTAYADSRWWGLMATHSSRTQRSGTTMPVFT